MKRRHSCRYIVGIDEVGRGPLAGPVAVCAVKVERDCDRSLFRGVRDSKKMTALAREECALRAKEAVNSLKLEYKVAYVSAPVIDRIGIAVAIRLALKRALSRLDVDPSECLVLLDGGLYAPGIFQHQETIIRGDDSEPVIALASVIAKVHRDKKMRQFAKKFPDYAFDAHKGYGTLRHREAVKEFGPCELHRRSFLHI